MTTRRPFRFIAVTRLENVVLGELLQSLAVSLGGMMVLMVIAGAYRPIREGLPLGALLRFLPLSIPYFLPWILPTAFVAACMMVYSRMAASNELTAVRAAGVHLWRIFSPAALIAVLMCILCGWLNNVIVPEAHFRQWAMLRAPTPSQLAAGILYSDPVMEIGEHSFHMREVSEDNSIRDLVVMINEGSTQALTGLTIESDDARDAEPGSPGSTTGPAQPAGREKARQTVLFVRAPRGRFDYSDQRSQITFHVQEDPSRNTPASPYGGWCSLVRQEFGTSVRNFEEAWFRSATLTIRVKSEADLAVSSRKYKHLTSATLLLKLRRRAQRLARDEIPAEIRRNPKKLRRWRNRVLRWATELHERAALSLAPLLLGAVACPLAVLAGRGRRLVAFGVALAIMLGLYYPLMAGGTSMGKAGMISPAVAVWGANGVLVVLGVVLIRRVLRQ
jgi:lipopolysaccharide export LptBFGC system permease protein LptF